MITATAGMDEALPCRRGDSKGREESVDRAMEGHMKRFSLVIAVVTLLGGAALLVLGHLGGDVSRTVKNDVGAPVSSRGAGVAVAAELPRTSRTMHATEATSALATTDSRLDNYRLERDSCCVGND